MTDLHDKKQVDTLLHAVWIRGVRQLFLEEDARKCCLSTEPFVRDIDTYAEVCLTRGYGQDGQHARWVITWEDIAVKMYCSRSEVVDWVIENLTQLGDMVGLRRKPPPPPRWRVDFRVGTRSKRRVTDRLARRT